jgi:hypothetical protein
VYLSLFFDAVGVGHAAWLMFFATRKLICGKHIGSNGSETNEIKPSILRVKSAELLAATGSVYGLSSKQASGEESSKTNRTYPDI